MGWPPTRAMAEMCPLRTAALSCAKTFQSSEAAIQSGLITIGMLGRND